MPNTPNRNRLLQFTITVTLALLSCSAVKAAFNDTGWTVQYQENFDTPFSGVDGQTFGTDDWLIFQLHNGGQITSMNGYAWLNAPEYWHAALIRSTHILPAEYKIRTKIGHINYDLDNYEQADFDDPNFNDHSGHPENGMYFLTVTNDTCVDNQCAENWWHYHRKMVIDVDNHINWDAQLTETFHPTYMVYMDPATNSGGHLLRTWDGAVWDSSAWNWNTAYVYDYNTWYYAELEKRNGQIRLALYDADSNLIEGPPPIDFDLVFAMNNPTEFLYVGEPHTDDYEGDVRIDEITMLIPSTPCCVGETGDVNLDGNRTLTDLTQLANAIFVTFEPVACPAAGNASGDPACELSLTDLTRLVNFLFVTFDPPADCNPACE